MSKQSRMQAAPPDDGGHDGVHTSQEPSLTDFEDTRASETLGETELRDRRPNQGLALFWLGIGALCAIMFLVTLLVR